MDLDEEELAATRKLNVLVKKITEDTKCSICNHYVYKDQAFEYTKSKTR